MKGRDSNRHDDGTLLRYYGDDDPKEIGRLLSDIGLHYPPSAVPGGCCGMSCDHISAMREVIDTHRKGDRPFLENIVERPRPLVNKKADSTPEPDRQERRHRRAYVRGNDAKF